MRTDRLRPTIPEHDTLTRSLQELHAALAEHVRRRRDAGAPVAEVLPEVRAMVRSAERSEGWRDPSDTLLEWIEQLTVEVYGGARMDRVPRAR
jgi:hypothetical protein